MFHQRARSKLGRFTKQSSKIRLKKLISRNKSVKCTPEKVVCDQPQTPTYEYEKQNLNGRLIIEADYVMHQLKSGCQNCSHELNFCDITKRVRHGLANVFKVTCTACTYVNNVYSSKRHYPVSGDKKHTRPTFDINTKCAAGKYVLIHTTTSLKLITPAHTLPVPVRTKFNNANFK